MSTKIEAVKVDQTFKHPQVKYPKIMPQHPFSMLVLAPKGSGKTNMICNLLLNHYKGYFHKILIASPTIDNDPKWDVIQKTKHILKENKPLEKALGNRQKEEEPVFDVVRKSGGEKQSVVDKKKNEFSGKIPKDSFFASMDELPGRLAVQTETIAKLHELGKEQESLFISDRILVILDDQAGLFQGGNTNNPMVNIVIKHRHFNMSIIVVTQANKAIPKTIRTNCNSLVCFEIPNLAELKTVYEEWPTDLPEEAWTRAYKFATEKNFSFMYVNNHFPKGHRMFRNFETKLQFAKRSSLPSKKRKREEDE